MRKSFLLLGLSFLCYASSGIAEEITLTTYYPAPSGRYQNFSVSQTATISTLIVRAPSGDAGSGNATIDGATAITGSTTIGTGGNMITLNALGTINAPGNIAGGSISTGGLMSAGSMTTGTLAATGNISSQGAFLYTSDARLKENISPITDALGKVDQLKGVYYFLKTRPDEKRIGLIAQDTEPVVPEVVRTGEDGMKSVDYASLTALLIQGMKEQQAEINILKERVKTLEAVK